MSPAVTAAQLTALGHDNARPDKHHKDKLAETKKREKEVKDSLKTARIEEKERKEQARLEVAAAYRMDRKYFHPASKRAARDARQAARHETRREAGDYCEHGVWKCKICHPVDHHK